MDKKRNATIIEQMLTLVNMQEDGSFVEAEVSDSARQVKEFIDEIPGGFLIYQAGGKERIIFANKELLRIFGCGTFAEFKELTGDSFKGVVYQEDLEKVRKIIKSQISNNQAGKDYIEYRIRAKDGTIRWVEDYGHYIKSDSAGNIYYVFITEATEKINKRQQEHMQRLEVIEGLSSNYDSILHISLDKDTVLPYRLSTRLVKQFKELLQERQYTSFVDEYVKMWVHPEDKELVREKLMPDYIRTALKEDKTYYLNFKCIQNGETKYLQARLANVTQGDSVSQVVIGYRNVDEELEQEIQKKTLLENALNDSKLANIAKNTFLSSISHDMRTPLNALFGYLELAKKNINDKTAIESYLGKVNTAAKQLLDLVDKVLQTTYLESKDFQLNEQLCNLKDLTSEIYRELLPEAKKKEINITLDQLDVVHNKVYTDKDKLRQILLNVAGNAVKYTGNGGNVSLIMQECPSTSSDFATFKFIMNDNGIGMSPDFLDKVFQPFERENNSTQSGVFGSGLGLAIAKQIIDRMGGTITAESSMGVGSTFTATLSFRLSEKRKARSETEGVTEFIKDKKILLVEDNEINLEIETEILQDLGLIIEPAENGAIAVEKVKNSSPDEYLFILMDIQMPVMDGWQATENIRKLDNPALAQIPIIALSANAFESDKRNSVKNGMNAHLNKPLDVTALLDTVKRTIMD